MNRNLWFGPAPWAPLCRDLERAGTPTGQLCLHCGEPIASQDSGEIQGDRPIHRECLLRLIVGSVGHQAERCPCFGGTEMDPPGMTVRQAALAAAAEFDRREHGTVGEGQRP